MSAERRWVAIEHVPYESPAAIATAAAARGLELEVCRPYLGETLPAHAELGLQFHVEVDPALIAGWREHLPDGVEIGEQAQADVERCGRATLAAFFEIAAG